MTAGVAEPRRVRLSAIVPATDVPATLEACLAAIRAAADGPDELIVVREPSSDGPAAARNRGAALATSEVLVFVDADVVVHLDAFSRIRDAFAADPGLSAVFGAYDDRPAADGAVSVFRNLLHHHVHASSAGAAATFWTGIGAVRRDAFVRHGGFDERRYPAASIEDVELGTRMAAGGERIVLDPMIAGTHLKAWTLAEVLRTDFARRGVPWIVLLCEQRSIPTTLNLRWSARLSALASTTAVVAACLRRPRTATASVLALVVLNREFYALLYRRRGPSEAAFGVGLHILHHLMSACAVPVGVGVYLALRRQDRRRGTQPGPDYQRERPERPPRRSSA